MKGAVEWVTITLDSIFTHNSSRKTSTMGPLDDYGVSDKITVEHLLILSVSDPLRQALVAWGNSSKGTMKSFQILGYAAAAYLVMAGVSCVIDSIRSKRKDNE